MRLGTRRSALALAQAQQVAELLGGAEIVPIATSGDRERPPVDDKSRWVHELEQALLRDEIDLAVHSAKDVPATMPEQLAILGVPARAPAADALCGRALTDIPAGGRIGTTSLRRRAQLLALRPDVEVAALRGNVDTRLRRLHDGDYVAVALALAGLRRLGRENEATEIFDTSVIVPAPGQGALALQGRAGDPATTAAAAAISDRGARCTLLAERALVRALQADCHTPLGAHAVLGPEPDQITLTAWVGLPDGSEWIRDQLAAPTTDGQELGETVAQRLLGAGAAELLERAQAAGRRS